MKRTTRVCLALLLTGATFALAGGSLFAISGRVDGWGAGTVTIGAFGYEEEFLISRSILNPDGSFALSLPDLSGVTMRHPPAPPTCLVDDAVTLKAEPAGLLVYESASLDKIAVVKDNAFVGILDFSSHSMEAGAPQADLGYLFFASGLQKAFWQYWSGAGQVTGTCVVRTREKVLY
jgi:hypothetical protein